MMSVKKDVLDDIKLFARDDSFNEKQTDSWAGKNGNDLLYFFCENCRIPTLEEVESQRRINRDRELLTPAEAHFADQMWLIGRSYAASPERYSYSNGRDKGKPKDDLLSPEGYESFFQDIARMLFREECQGEKPVAYFRDRREGDLESRIMKLVGDNTSGFGWIEILNKESQRKVKESIDICTFRKDLKNATGIVKMAGEQLESKRRLFDKSENLGLLDKERTEPNRPSLLSTNLPENQAGLRNAIDLNSDNTEQASYLVGCFADLLNAARKLRDITIIIRTLEELKDKAMSQKGEIFKSNNEARSWAALPKRVQLVEQGKPSTSISFSSKFLHFHYPERFFIFDSISSQNAPHLDALYKDFESFEVSETTYTNLLDRTKRAAKTEKNRSEQKRLAYLMHALQELKFANFLFGRLLSEQGNDKNYCEELVMKLIAGKSTVQNGCPIPHYTNMTRLVDELVMNGDALPQSSGNDSGSH